ncbi:DUF1330 domain-containing protein [Mucilaginibacter sp. cycad4]|uniref:DUF1330 domain-containing protein n=1 Tax=Mucilaginibacter sp. cycad4 TaxID=3342096 RepID=UPI002AAAB0B8|nr:DUF1330 domain-containing protein [Mucilaginibacter gossypii]WPU99156.1 DUF1330 domain-containing protein [Mucilaginibacter gossypii]
MSAYILFQRLNQKDAAELDFYEQNIGTAIGDHPIEILAYGTKHENLEGQPTETARLVKFPSMEDAKKWYYSDAYTALRAHRTAGGDHMAVLFEGNE